MTIQILNVIHILNIIHTFNDNTHIKCYTDIKLQYKHKMIIHTFNDNTDITYYTFNEILYI